MLPPQMPPSISVFALDIRPLLWWWNWYCQLEEELPLLWRFQWIRNWKDVPWRKVGN